MTDQQMRDCRTLAAGLLSEELPRRWEHVQAVGGAGQELHVDGLDQVLRQEFPIDPDLPHDELCYCDMTNGPQGQPMTLAERLDDILSRYGPGSVVFDAISEATPECEKIVARVLRRNEPVR